MEGMAATTLREGRHTSPGLLDRSVVRRTFLLGTGVVGRALMAHHSRIGDQLGLPRIVGIANSRGYADVGPLPEATLEDLNRLPAREDSCFQAVSLRHGDVIVDATASPQLATQHAEWLAGGVSVVTANKLGLGGSLQDANRLHSAAKNEGVHYGYSATVGAGLPVLRALQRLVRSGEVILRIEGILSGSMGWLFSQFDGTSFGALVDSARQAGYTEPDPRVDLSGEDIARKLLILGRCAGFPLERSDIVVEPATPTTIDTDGAEGFHALDGHMAELYHEAAKADRRLCYMGQVCRDGGRVALRGLEVGHPLRGARYTDNRVAIHCSRYDTHPLVIQGAGAGPTVTAAALIDDLLQTLSTRP